MADKPAPPFSREQLLQNFKASFELPENLPQPRSKTRASALADCARKQAYDMVPVAADPVGAEGSSRDYDADLTSEQGRMFEELMVRAMANAGYVVEDRQRELPSDFYVTGHPDGSLVHDGERWGVEFKHLGRFGYLKTLRNFGVRESHPNYVVQSSLYAEGLGWDNVLWVVTSQDASSIRTEAKRNAGAKDPSVRWTATDWHPKLTLDTISVDELRPLFPMNRRRAEWLAAWREQDGVPGHVAREYDPSAGKFPCTYCPFLQSCLSDGDGGKDAPGYPFETMA